MEIVDIRRREVTKLWCESWHYVTRTSSDVNICNPQLFSLLQKTFIGHNSRSNNPEVTKRKSRVSKWKSVPVSNTKTKALNVRSLSKHPNYQWALLKNAFFALTDWDTFNFYLADWASKTLCSQETDDWKVCPAYVKTYKKPFFSQIFKPLHFLHFWFLSKSETIAAWWRMIVKLDLSLHTRQGLIDISGFKSPVLMIQWGNLNFLYSCILIWCCNCYMQKLNYPSRHTTSFQRL